MASFSFYLNLGFPPFFIGRNTLKTGGVVCLGDFVMPVLRVGGLPQIVPSVVLLVSVLVVNLVCRWVASHPLPYQAMNVEVRSVYAMGSVAVAQTAVAV